MTYEPPALFFDNCDLVNTDPRLNALAKYLELLLNANKAFNLTAIRDPAEAWNRHILEAVALSQRHAFSGRILDLGSGGGLPGIPLAIMRPDISVTLMDATRKKTDFLEQTAAELQLNNVRVINCRAEDAARDKSEREQYDGVICRAVGSLAEIIELSVPFLRVNGVLLALKGLRIHDELSQAENAMALLHAKQTEYCELLPNLKDNDSVLVKIQKMAATSDKYPRRQGIPKKRPL